MSRKYNRSNIAIHLSEYDLSMKELADWCGMSEGGLSRALKKECEDGFSSVWQWIIIGFLIENGKGGFTLSHEIFE